ncbi:hypothetical protein [Streptacidiphilus sp. EB129]|uniref:hypothetical protein n=1 Tax=Streptacidiphilus sp. EB129 TaxID=3156262 RepID=UPI003515E9DC
MPATPTICPGPCNNAYRKAEEALTDIGTEHNITAIWGEPTQCWGCVDNTRSDLTALPGLLAKVLEEGTDGTTIRINGTIGRAPEATWPGQAPRLLVDRIVSEMAELAADILVLRGIWREDHPVPTGTAANEKQHINNITSSLLGHWDWAMQSHPAAGESYGRGNANPGAQASGWYWATVYFTKDHAQPEVKRFAPCPRCHGPYLIESREGNLRYGEPYIECRDEDCRKLMSKREYAEYVKAMTKAIRAGAEFGKVAA